jgi:hypothetical protein
MSQEKQATFNRRRFLKHTAQGAMLIPLLSVTGQSAWAAEKLQEDEPTAVALGYVHDATKVDLAKFPKRAGEEGAKQFCDNCSQYKATEDGWGTCAIFPNKLVAAKGWCNVWVPMA